MDPISLALLLASGSLVAFSLRTDEEEVPVWEKFLADQQRHASEKQLVAFDWMQETGLVPPVLDPKREAKNYVDQLCPEDLITFWEDETDSLLWAFYEDRDVLSYVDLDEVELEVKDELQRRLRSVSIEVEWVGPSDSTVNGLDADLEVHGVNVQITLLRDSQGRWDSWGTLDHWSSRPLHIELQDRVIQAVRERAAEEDL